MNDTTTEKMLCAELTMLLGNVTSRLRRHQSDGFHVLFSKFAARCCDDDNRLARRVLLRAGWVPSVDGKWITGRGRNDLGKVTEWEVLESACESILDDYRPISDRAA